MSVDIIELGENDLLPFLDVEFEGADLTGDEVYLDVEREDGHRFSVKAEIDNVGDPANGVPALFHFEWSEGDLVRGFHKAQIKFFDGVRGAGGVKQETWNGLRLNIPEDLAPP